MTIVFFQNKPGGYSLGMWVYIFNYKAVIIKLDHQTVEFLVSMWGKLCRYNSLEPISLQ